MTTTASVMPSACSVRRIRTRSATPATGLSGLGNSSWETSRVPRPAARMTARFTSRFAATPFFGLGANETTDETVAKPMPCFRSLMGSSSKAHRATRLGYHVPPASDNESERNNAKKSRGLHPDAASLHLCPGRTRPRGNRGCASGETDASMRRFVTKSSTKSPRVRGREIRAKRTGSRRVVGVRGEVVQRPSHSVPPRIGGGREGRYATWAAIDRACSTIKTGACDSRFLRRARGLRRCRPPSTEDRRRAWRACPGSRAAYGGAGRRRPRSRGPSFQT